MYQFILFSLMLFTLSSVGISQAPPPPAPKQTVNRVPPNASLLGEMNGSEYVNDYFGLRIEIPQGYVIVDRNELELLQKAGVEIIGGDSETNTKRIETAVNQTVILLGVFRDHFGTPNNSGIEIGAVRQQDGVTARMVLAASSSLLTRNGGYKLKRSLTDRKFGGVTFVGAEFERDIAGVTIKQHSYVAMRRGYSLLVTIVYSTDEGLKAMQQLLDGMAFKQK